MSTITTYARSKVDARANKMYAASAKSLQEILADRFGPEHQIVVRWQELTEATVVGEVDYETVDAVAFTLALEGKEKAPVRAVLIEGASGEWRLHYFTHSRRYFRKWLNDVQAAELLERSR